MLVARMQFHALVKTVIYCIDPILIKIIIQPLFSDLFGNITFQGRHGREGRQGLVLA